MRSWDRFLVPWPFTRIVVSWSHWTHVREDLPEAGSNKNAKNSTPLSNVPASTRSHTLGKPMFENSPPKGKSAERVADFDYELPQDLIAQQPPAERGTSRMLVMDRATGAFEDDLFSEFAARSSIRRPARSQ